MTSRCPVHKALDMTSRMLSMVNSPTKIHENIVFDHDGSDMGSISKSIWAVPPENIIQGMQIRYTTSKEDKNIHKNPHQLTDVWWQTYLLILEGIGAEFTHDQTYCDINHSPDGEHLLLLAVHRIDRIVSCAIEFSRDEDQYRSRISAGKKLAIKMATLPNHVESKIAWLLDRDLDFSFFEKFTPIVKDRKFKYGICPAIQDGTISHLFSAIEAKMRECYPLWTPLTLQEKWQLDKQRNTYRIVDRFSNIDTQCSPSSQPQLVISKISLFGLCASFARRII